MDKCDIEMSYDYTRGFPIQLPRGKCLFLFLFLVAMKPLWVSRLAQLPAAVVGLAEGPQGLMHVKWRPRAARGLRCGSPPLSLGLRPHSRPATPGLEGLCLEQQEHDPSAHAFCSCQAALVLLLGVCILSAPPSGSPL